MTTWEQAKPPNVWVLGHVREWAPWLVKDVSPDLAAERVLRPWLEAVRLPRQRLVRTCWAISLSKCGHNITRQEIHELAHT
jgi:hypothetical protein